MVREFNIQPSVHLLGLRDNVTEVFNAGNVLVSAPMRKDGQMLLVKQWPAAYHVLQRMLAIQRVSLKRRVA